MDTRKVLEMGGGTVLISLPKAWAKRNHVSRGSSVVVDELSPGRLIISPIGDRDEGATRQVVIEYSRENLAYLLNEITGAYLIGSDVIRIEGKQLISREDRDRMKAMIRRLVGLEIMDEDSKSITLQFLPEPSALDPEKIVRRMVSLTLGMMRDTREGILLSDGKMLALVVERDDEVDRLYFLLVRAIRTATIDPVIAERYRLEPVECLDYRVLASFLESLGDTIAELSLTASEEVPRKEVGKAFGEAFVTLEEMEEVAIRSFLARRTGVERGSWVEIAEMHDRIDSVSRRVSQMKDVPPRSIIDLLSLLERISKIFVDISDLSLPTYVFKKQSLAGKETG